MPALSEWTDPISLLQQSCCKQSGMLLHCTSNNILLVCFVLVYRCGSCCLIWSPVTTSLSAPYDDISMPPQRLLCCPPQQPTCRRRASRQKCHVLMDRSSITSNPATKAHIDDPAAKHRRAKALLTTCRKTVDRCITAAV